VLRPWRTAADSPESIETIENLLSDGLGPKALSNSPAATEREHHSG
jgi:hypothetical protein